MPLAGDYILAADFTPSAEDQETGSIGSITSTSFAAGSPVCGVSFTAPTSGIVEVDISAQMSNTGGQTYMSFRVGTGGTIGAGTEVVAASADTSVLNGATSSVRAGTSKRVTGLTPGATYNAQTMHAVTAGTGTVLRRTIKVRPST